MKNREPAGEWWIAATFIAYFLLYVIPFLTLARYNDTMDETGEKVGEDAQPCPASFGILPVL